MGTEKWWDKSITLVDGCTPVSDGCDHCWAAGMAHRFQGGLTTDEIGGRFNGKIICREDRLERILKRKKPTRWVIWNDLFHPSVPVTFIDRIRYVIRDCPQHTFQILTKRPQRMWKYFYGYEPLPNLWLGVTIESPNYWKRAKILQEIPAAIKFLSLEPLIANLGDLDLRGIDWVIIGGESGPKARYCQNSWVVDIVNQCKAASVSVFVKQLHLNGKAKAIKDIDQFPPDLRIREFPKGR